MEADTGKWSGEPGHGGNWSNDGSAIEGVSPGAFGEVRAKVTDHGRRLDIVEGHPVSCSAARAITDIVAWKNQWAGAMVVLQVVSILLGILAVILKVRS